MNAVTVLDWGIGGWPTLLALRQHLGDITLRYVSDAGFTPYGKVSRPALAARLDTLCDRFPGRFIVACNAASVAVPATTSPGSFFDIVAVGAAGLSAEDAPVAVLGGELTATAGAHEAALARRGVEAFGVVAQPLSAIVERGVTAGPEAEAAVRDVLSRCPNARTLWLACTHYPALADVFAALAPGIPIYDPAPRFAAAAAAWLESGGLPPPGSVSVLTTDARPGQLDGLAASLGASVTRLAVESLDAR